MTPEEREVRRKRLQEAARAGLEAIRKEEDELVLAKFKDASHGTKSIAMCLLETKRAAELSLRNSKIAIQILLVQNGQDMVDWDNLKEPTPPMPSNDQTGTKCRECGKGVYKETGVQDDMFGVLHCSIKSCRHQVDRWV